MKVILCGFLMLLNQVADGNKTVVCYYGSWATISPGLGQFDVSDINAELCTHIVYSFTSISSEGTVVSLDPYLDLAENWSRDNYRQFTNLQQKNPNLKTLLAVGGWNEGSKRFSIEKSIVKSAERIFIIADNFSTLLREMRQEFDKYGFLLSAAVAAVEATASKSYDIPTISQYLDYVNIMAYDMHGSWDAVTGHNAPLYKGIGDKDFDRKELNTVDVALEYWIKQGCPPEKIILGVPFYARTFTLTNASKNSVRAPSSSPGIAGPYTATPGFIGYNEFCKKLHTESWTVQHDILAKVPYAFQNKNWVSFDNPDSIKKKVEFGVSLKIAGVMVWSIELDVFNNVCGGGDFPMLRAVNEVLDIYD